MQDNVQVNTSEDNQVDSTVNDQVDETVNQPEVETPVIEQIGELLNGNQTTDEPETETATQEQQQVEPEKKETPIIIIDDAMIQQFPTLKMYRGKPLLDYLPKAYHNVTLAYSENQKKLKQLEKEQAKQKLPDISTIPDMVEKPEEFKKWLAEEKERIRQEVLSEIPQPEVNWVAKVQEVLPKEADINKVIDSWDKFNAERLYDESGGLRPEIQQFYNTHPQILIEEIKKFYNLSSQAEKNSMTIQSEANNKAYKTITNSIKKSNENKENVTAAQFNQIPRTEQSTPEDEMLANIYKIAQG